MFLLTLTNPGTTIEYCSNSPCHPLSLAQLRTQIDSAVLPAASSHKPDPLRGYAPVLFMALYNLLCTIKSLLVVRSSTDKHRNNITVLKIACTAFLPCKYFNYDTGGRLRCNRTYPCFVFVLRPHFSFSVAVTILFLVIN